MKIDSKIVEEINAIKVKGDMTLQQIFNEFYKLMKKYDIYQWKKAPDRLGHMGSSPEYVMCYTLFKHHLEMQMAWFTLGASDLEFEIPDYMYEGGQHYFKDEK